MRDKEVAAPVGRALRACAEVIATPVSLPRSRNVDELGELLAAHELRGEVAADPARALSGLARRLTAEDAVLVTGSGFLVAEVLYRLGFKAIDETRQPEPAARRLQSWREGEDGAPTTTGPGGGH
jgi:folylpolyglutamate synthase/dihydropteroate synthase